MAVTKILSKNFGQFSGLDLESSDITRPAKYASDMLNADLSGANALVKRPGFQAIVGNVAGMGMGLYENVNTTTAAVTETAVTFNDSLHVLTDDSFTITYSGSSISLLNISMVSGVFRLIITENNVEILNQNLGIGYDEAVATTISTVISAIDALADYAATGGTITTGSAAFLNLKDDVQLTSAATTVAFRRWAQANEPKANPLATTLTKVDNVDFENPTSVSMNNILYVATGYDELMKYDGQNFYRAGMPSATPVLTAGADTNAGSIADGNYYYKFLYRQVDNKGNIVEGIISSASAVVNAAAGNNGSFPLTVTHLTASSGFNTGCAIINGAQSSTTTLTVTTGHTLLAGDTAYFYDSVSSGYVTRVLTAVTSTSITWAATTSVTVASAAVISNNLMISIYRTLVGAPSTNPYYLVADIPNDSITGTPATYLDIKADASLGAEYIIPIKAHGLPPKCKYITSHVSLIVMTGDLENANTVYYSDIDSPEYFPPADNSFLVDAFPGAKTTGIGSLETVLVVFKDRSVQGITGDLPEDTFRVDEIPYGGIGCEAHHSIQKIGSSLLFLSKKGVYSVSTQGIIPIGKNVEREFLRHDAPYTLKKATSANWVSNSKYVLFLPSMTGTYADSDSIVFAYDYDDTAWLKWNNINALGGFSYANERLLFCSLRLDSDSATSERTTNIFNEYGDRLDFTDHHEVLTFTYSTHWESLGEPDIFKKFLYLKIFALPNDIIAGSVPLYTLTIDQEFNYNSPAVISSFTMDFSGGTSGYGLGSWGASPWGDSALTEIKGKLKVLKARSMRLTFSNAVAGENVLISGYELAIAPPYRAEMKE